MLVGGCAQPRSSAGNSSGPSASPSVPLASASSDAGREQVAHTVATRLLAEVHLPSGSTQVSSAPAPMLTAPAAFPMSPNLVDVSAWWTAPGSVDDLIAYVQAHPPAGLDGSGGGYGGGSTELTFGGTSTADYAAPQLVIVATASGGRVAVRADAQVIWRPARTAAETVPTDVSAATVARSSDASRRMVVLNDKQRRAVAGLLNNLDTVAPARHGCPAIISVTTITFQTAAEPLVFTVNGCLDVAVTAAGVAQPALQEADNLDAWIDSLFGIAVSPGPSTTNPPPIVTQSSTSGPPAPPTS